MMIKVILKTLVLWHAVTITATTWVTNNTHHKIWFNNNPKTNKHSLFPKDLNFTMKVMSATLMMLTVTIWTQIYMSQQMSNELVKNVYSHVCD